MPQIVLSEANIVLKLQTHDSRQLECRRPELSGLVADLPVCDRVAVSSHPS